MVRPSVTPSKADELENLFSQLSLKTPGIATPNSKKPAIISSAPDSDNDEFEDCISSLPSSPKSKANSFVVPEEDDDSEIIFNNKLHDTSVNAETKDETLADIPLEDLEKDPESSSEHRLSSGEQLPQSTASPVKEPETVEQVAEGHKEKCELEVTSEVTPIAEQDTDVASEVSKVNIPETVESGETAAAVEAGLIREAEGVYKANTSIVEVTKPVVTESDHIEPAPVNAQLNTEPELAEAVQSLVTSAVSEATNEVLQEPECQQKETLADPEPVEPSVPEKIPKESVSDTLTVTSPVETSVVSDQEEARAEPQGPQKEEIFEEAVEIVQAEESKTVESEPTKDVSSDPVQIETPIESAAPKEVPVTQEKVEIPLHSTVIEPIQSDEPMEVSTPVQLEQKEENSAVEATQGEGLQGAVLQDPVQIDEPSVAPQVVATTPAAAEAPQDSVMDTGEPRESYEPSSESVDPLSNVAGAPASPPILPKKGTYNFDFDNFDENSDPFAATLKVAASPLPSKSVANESEVDPFKSSNAIPNSPAPAKLESTEEQAQSKQNSTVVNSPVPSKVAAKEDLVKAKPAVANSPAKISEAEDPFKASKTIMNSPPPAKPELSEDVDPFKPSKAMANSPPPSKPVTSAEVDPFKPSKAIANSPPPSKPEISAGVDPFKPSKAITNSPPPSKKKKVPTATLR